MDEARFWNARDKAYGRFLHGDGSFAGIGRLSEKTLHAALKYYYEPDPAFHEVPCGDFVADIRREDGIIEIQSGQFHRLLPKLEAFLSLGSVTVVYPLIVEKQIVWIEKDSGEAHPPRKSPRAGKNTDFFAEIDAIRGYLTNENLHIRVVLLHMTEYRLLDGYGRGAKKRATKVDRVPTALLGELAFDTPEDYRAYLPDGLPARFLISDLAAALSIRNDIAGAMLRVFRSLGFVRVSGKRGKALEYEILG